MQKQIGTSTLAAALSAALLACAGARADEFSWNKDGSGNWDDPGNWTLLSGSSGRTYPNNGADIAHLKHNISGDVTVTLPVAGVAVLRVEAGDSNASHRYILAGGAITAAGADPALAIANGATVQLDANMTGVAFAKITGSGLLIVSGTMNNNRVWNINSSSANLTTRIDGGRINSVNDNIRLNAGRLEIGNDDFSNAPNGLSVAAFSKFAAFNGNRSVNRAFSIAGPDSAFDGSNGFNLAIGGQTTITVPSGRAIGIATFLPMSSKLTLGGALVLVVSDVSRTFHRHPIRLVDGAVFELTGTSATAHDLVVDGSGTVLLNNATGSATGAGTAIVLGTDHAAGAGHVVLGGSGATLSSVTVYKGSIAPGNGGIGTLSVGATTFNAGTRYAWERDGEATDLLAVDGNLTVHDTFEIRIAQHALGKHDTVDIIAYTGSFSGNPAAWTLTPPTGASGFDKLAVENTGTAIRLTGLPTLPRGTTVLIR